MLMALLSRVYREHLWRGVSPLRALSTGRTGHPEPHLPRVVLQSFVGAVPLFCSHPGSNTGMLANGLGRPRSGHAARSGLERERA